MTEWLSHFSMVRRIARRYAALKAGSASMRRSEAIRITYLRSRHQPRAVLVDQNLDLHSVDQLRRWARNGVAFVVVDADTGQDITLVLLA